MSTSTPIESDAAQHRVRPMHSIARERPDVCIVVDEENDSAPMQVLVSSTALSESPVFNALLHGAMGEGTAFQARETTCCEPFIVNLPEEDCRHSFISMCHLMHGNMDTVAANITTGDELFRLARVVDKYFPRDERRDVETRTRRYVRERLWDLTRSHTGPEDLLKLLVVAHMWKAESSFRELSLRLVMSIPNEESPTPYLRRREHLLPQKIEVAISKLRGDLYWMVDELRVIACEAEHPLPNHKDPNIWTLSAPAVTGPFSEAWTPELRRDHSLRHVLNGANWNGNTLTRLLETLRADIHRFAHPHGPELGEAERDLFGTYRAERPGGATRAGAGFVCRVHDIVEGLVHDIRDEKVGLCWACLGRGERDASHGVGECKGEAEID